MRKPFSTLFRFGRRYFSSNTLNQSQPKLKWYPIPIGLGIAWLSLLQLKHIRDREDRRKPIENTDKDYLLDGPVHIHFYSTMPLKIMSRLWGTLNNKIVPEWLREPLYGLYSSVFKCNLNEALVEDLKTYPNLASFFYRKLKPNARQVDDKAEMTSPADGTVLHFGIVDENHRVEQVKGVTYSLPALLGKHQKRLKAVDEDDFAEINDKTYSLDTMMGTTSEHKHLYQHKPTNSLYFCVIYLAPGDYHRFHSPVEWQVEKRRHFSGELYSVSPWIVQKLRNLFVLNERVVLLGKWKHGFFSMIPVGATNVGSIKINFDPELVTNTMEKLHEIDPGCFQELAFSAPVSLKKGDEVGGFQLGSTIVLVFEAPPNFTFNVEAGQQIKMGQELGSQIQ